MISFLCALPLWIFRPFAVLNLESHCSHGNASRWFWLVSKPVTTVDFLARKSSLRLAFLFRVDELFFFLIFVGRVALPSLVSKEKVEPMVMESLKSLPWRARAWQKSRHWVAREESISLTVVVFVSTSELSFFWKEPKSETCCW